MLQLPGQAVNYPGVVDLAQPLNHRVGPHDPKHVKAAQRVERHQASGVRRRLGCAAGGAGGGCLRHFGLEGSVAHGNLQHDAERSSRDALRWQEKAMARSSRGRKANPRKGRGRLRPRFLPAHGSKKRGRSRPRPWPRAFLSRPCLRRRLCIFFWLSREQSWLNGPL